MISLGEFKRLDPRTVWQRESDAVVQMGKLCTDCQAE